MSCLVMEAINQVKFVKNDEIDTTMLTKQTLLSTNNYRRQLLVMFLISYPPSLSYFVGLCLQLQSDNIVLLKKHLSLKHLSSVCHICGDV